MHIKKIFSVFLVVALLLSSLVVTTSATEVSPEIFEVEVEALTTTSTLSSSPIIYNPGEEFTVNFRAIQNTGITSVMLYIDYDETAISVVENSAKVSKLFTSADALSSNVTAKGDGYLVFVSDNYPKVSTATGVFAQITFKVNAVCAAESLIKVTTFQNSPGNCVVQTISGSKVVPFKSNDAVFSIHANKAESGVVTAPTCTEKGYTTYSCPTCKVEFVGNYVDAKGHTDGEYVHENIVNPSCTVDGSYDNVMYCAVCNVELSRTKMVITAPGHSEAAPVEENRVESDCTKEGSYDTVVYCSVCNVELSRKANVIPELGHDLVHTEAKAPTCTDIGWEAYDTCKREGCGYTTYKELAALGHDLVHTDAKAPTCTEKGWDAYDTCKREGCGYTTYKELAALGHDLVHTEAKAPTCTEKGWDAYDTCKREGCGYTTYVELEAKGHTYGDVTVVAPQYKVEGYSTHTCTVCQFEEKFDITPALTYILGDTNGDEEINDKDAVQLLYNTFLPDLYPVNQECDFNGDGEVNDKDAVYLLYYTFLPDLYPLS